MRGPDKIYKEKQNFNGMGSSDRGAGERKIKEKEGSKVSRKTELMHEEKG